MEEELADICKTLQYEYNGGLMKYVDDNIKEEFKTISAKFKDGDKGNIPLLNVIYNYFNGFLPAPKYVSGPMSITYQTSVKYEMKIYILGEYHGHSKQCNELSLDARLYNMDISQYLQKVFLNSDKFIDFYLEDELFRTVKTNRNKDFLNMLRDDFDKCLNPSTRSSCIFKTIRTHFVDTRRIQDGPILTGTSDINKLRMYLETKNDETESHTDTINQLKTLKSYADIADYILGIAIKIPIILKELERSRLGKDLIISIFRDLIIERHMETFTLNHWNEMFNVPNRLPLELKIFILILIESPLVDIYTVARMFKTFKKTNYLPDKPRYIIYYAGDNHAIAVRRFLKKLMFFQEFQRNSDTVSSTRCLDMKNIRLNFE